MSKTALITGPTSGIGRHTAIQLAEKGYDLILVARNAAKAIALQNEIGDSVHTDFVECDLSSIASVRRAVDEIRTRYQRLDLLINNAGLIVQRRETTPEGIERTFATNHVGPFVLTTGLVGLLKAADGARIVNLASEAHFFALRYATRKLANPPHYHDLVIYGRSKLANILFSNELAEQLAACNIASNAVHPGTVSSSFGGDGNGATAWFMKMFKPFFRTPSEAAAQIVELATSEAFEGVTGQYFANSRPAKRSANAGSRKLARELWLYTERLITEPVEASQDS
ncbi:Short-chain dehydrogenase [Dyadobacter soli]|uniref:Short-chain dehydrogenase n=1 Tax=Dyadobacter soli TaxID=659014 RepID=A0A1G7SBD5_9BACT|nr:SDR family NAD(P)-dependent oxidoreductase [Dyadobacter soli]SDG20328.1 Short-chain dehydrogenase [Dyadobacter soli]